MKNKRIVLLALLFLIFQQSLILAQTELPWFWEYESPSTFKDIDLVSPCPATNASLYPLDYFTFQTAGVSVCDGSLIPTDMTFHIYFSTEGVTDPYEQTMWKGGHMHDGRPTDDAHRRVTLGGIETVPTSDDTNTSPTDVSVRIVDNLETIKILKPEAAGVIRIRDDSWISRDFPYYYRAFCDIENECFHFAPVSSPDNPDPDCVKHSYGEWAVFFGLGLEELPEQGTDGYYLKVRNPDTNHPDSVAFYGQHPMITALQTLAENYYNYTPSSPPDAQPLHRKLSFNDMSLPWGGLFDVSHDWTCAHTRHRTGRSVDINTTGQDIKIAALRKCLEGTNLRLNEYEYSTRTRIHLDYAPPEKPENTEESVEEGG